MAAQNVRSIHYHGSPPKDLAAREIFYNSGLFRHLKIDHRYQSPYDTKRYKSFNLVQGRKDKYNTARRSSQAEHVVSDLADYINKLLQTFHVELTPDGLGYLTQLIGEVIDNAEQHSILGEWYVLGYMLQGATNTGECHITIMNYGITIDGSMKSVTVRRDIKSIINAFKKRHFRQFNSRYAEGQFWTVLAMQEGMSCQNISKEQEIRGTGTIRMIEFIDFISNRTVESGGCDVILMSNDTMLRFDGKYQLQNTRFMKGDSLTIAFNPTNSLHLKPDPEYVVKMPLSFPGTLLSMRFRLDEEQLSKIARNE
jgi:hypothetical protein